MALLDDVKESARVYHDAVLTVDRVRSELYVKIVRAVREGIPAARVGRAAGLSRERVRQIVENYGREE